MLVSMGVEGSLSPLIDELQEKLKKEDLADLIDASKDDGVDEEALQKLTTTRQWLQWLCDSLLITSDDLSFVEHVFEQCRRPDLLTTVITYRLKNINSNEDELPARQCIRVPSAKKYSAAKLKVPDEKAKHSLQLSAPPKQRRKSSAI